MIHQINDSNFILQNLKTNTLPISNADISFVLVKAEWCGYCKQYMPMYKAFSDKFTDINFLVLDDEINATLSRQWENLLSPVFPPIKGFPTIIMYDQSGAFIKMIEDRSNLDKEILDYRTNGE